VKDKDDNYNTEENPMELKILGALNEGVIQSKQVTAKNVENIKLGNFETDNNGY